MDDQHLLLRLADDRRVYSPGDMLEGEYRFETVAFLQPRAVEISVLWHTIGKGEEDMAVHFFEHHAVGDGAQIDFRKPQSFRTRLPNSPLSYEGQLLKIRWCVRARVFLPRLRDLVTEVPFELRSAVASEAPRA